MKLNSHKLGCALLIHFISFSLMGCGNKAALKNLAKQIIGHNHTLPGSMLALGISNGNSLSLEMVDKSTGLPTSLRYFYFPGTINSFQLSQNKTRLFVQINNNQIYSYAIDSSSVIPNLTALSMVTIPEASTLGDICIAPDATSVHVVQRASSRLHSLKVDANDHLSYFGVTSEAPSQLINCRVTADSRFVVALGSTGLASFEIDSLSGSLNKKMELSMGGFPLWLEQSSDSRFFFVASQFVASPEDGCIQAFQMNLDTGHFSLSDRISTGFEIPDFVDVFPDGHSIYWHSQSQRIYALSFDPDRMAFGISSLVSDHSDLFYLDRVSNLIFQNSATGTWIFPLNTDGSKGRFGFELKGQSHFQTFVL